MVQMELHTGDDRILTEIERLLSATAGDVPDGDLARIEETLTSGYARALELEAERWRLERRLGTLAADLVGDGAEERVEELARLARRMADADGDLSRLRSLLAALRVRASALRAATASRPG
jgi:hypothetical protein